MPYTTPLRLLLGLSLFSISGLNAQGPGNAPAAAIQPCPTNLQPTDSASANGRCWMYDHGWIFSDDSTWAAATAAAVGTAADKFKQIFGEPIERGAIFRVANGAIADDRAARLAGARWVLPWSELSSSFDKDESGSVSHEAGHGWFKNWFNARSSRQARPGAYGTAAADWVDEAAAILMEDSSSRAVRRAHANQLAQTGQLFPLQELFTMAHPLGAGQSVSQSLSLNQQLPDSLRTAIAAALEKLGSGASADVDTTTRKALAASGITVATAPGQMVMGQMVTMGTQNGARVERTLTFYSQTSAFADFLFERSGDPSVFGSIAENEANGSDMTAWLRDNGARYRLPTTVGALEQEWQRWLSAARGAPPR